MSMPQYTAFLYAAIDGPSIFMQRLDLWKCNTVSCREGLR
jgi:hypothetical protein